MPKITVPSDMGSDLMQFPAGAYDFALKDIILGVSSTNNPKLTFRWICQSESENMKDFGKKYISTMGATLLDTYSLQPQALFKLNGIYKQATGDQLPHGDFEMEEFVEIVKEALQGAQARIIVEDNDDGARSQAAKTQIIK